MCWWKPRPGACVAAKIAPGRTRKNLPSFKEIYSNEAKWLLRRNALLKKLFASSRRLSASVPFSFTWLFFKRRHCAQCPTFGKKRRHATPYVGLSLCAGRFRANPLRAGLRVRIRSGGMRGSASSSGTAAGPGVPGRGFAVRRGSFCRWRASRGRANPRGATSAPRWTRPTKAALSSSPGSGSRAGTATPGAVSATNTLVSRSGLVTCCISN